MSRPQDVSPRRNPTSLCIGAINAEKTADKCVRIQDGLLYYLYRRRESREIQIEDIKLRLAIHWSTKSC